MDEGSRNIHDCGNAQREIDRLKETLESFIDDCKLFNKSIDDTNTRADLLQIRFSRIFLSFDDIYPLLKQIPNALVAFKLQLSMEILLDNARRVYESEVEPTVKRAHVMKRSHSYKAISPSRTNCTNPPVEDDNACGSDGGAHARLLAGGTTAFSGDKLETIHSSGQTSQDTVLPNPIELSELKSKPFNSLYDFVPNLDEEYVAYKAPVEQSKETHLEAQQRLDAFLLTPRLSTISSGAIEQFRLSIASAHQDLMELNLPNLADFMLYVFTLDRIPEDLKKEFQKTLEPLQVPTLQQLLDFLLVHESKLKAHDVATCVSGINKTVLTTTATYEPVFNPRKTNDDANGSVSSRSCERSCPVCFKPHPLRQCPNFLAYTGTERRSFMEKEDHICRNCLAESHRTSECKSLDCCKICSKRHHILLHPEPRLYWKTSQDQVKALSDLKREIGLFRRGKSPSPVSSSDGFILSSPSSDE